MRAYKGFNKDMTCRGFQYEVDKTYETDEAVCCESGFHACEMPLHCFHYYNPNDSVYCEVEQGGKISKSNFKKDTISSSTKIAICNKLNIKELVHEQINFVLKKIKKHDSDKDFDSISSSEDESLKSVLGRESTIALSGHGSFAATLGYACSIALSGHDSNAISLEDDSSIALSGNRSSAIASEDFSAVAISGYKGYAITSGGWSPAAVSGAEAFAISFGDCSCAVASGNRSSAIAEGDESIAASAGCASSATTNNKGTIAVCNGALSRAKGVLGSYIVLTEWSKDQTELLCAKMIKISGKKYKPDTWYTLRDGKVVPWKKEYLPDNMK